MTYSDGLYSGKMSSEREKENIENKKVCYIFINDH